MYEPNGDASSPPLPLPCLVSLPPFSTTRRRRRLSTTFLERNRPVSSEKPMAWISLQGLLVNAEEASSARTIGGGLTAELAFAWNLFPPIHRFLIVAVVAASVSAAESQKDKEISNLKKSVELRDQLLSSMQQKLDDLCEQLNSSNSKENTIAAANKFSTKDTESQLEETFGSERIKFIDCGCWQCEEHSSFYNESMHCASVKRASIGNEVLQYKTPFSSEDQEERRMSDLSDLASSVASAGDIQLTSLAVEQDVYNLKRDCEEKETTIQELTNRLNSSAVTNNKRVAELEDIIRRKNTTISKLKKDMVYLEQKVMQLTRLRRNSFPAGVSDASQLPQMRDNLIYDMESSTSPSSSDSDSSPVSNAEDRHVDVKAKLTPLKVLSSQRGVIEHPSNSQPISPLKEVSTNQKFNTTSSGQKQLSPRRDLKKGRRQSLPLPVTKSSNAHKRWL